MNCEDFLPELSALIDGESTETEEFTEHLAVCEACSEAYNDFLLLKEGMAGVADSELPEGFDERFFSELIEVRRKK